MGGLTGNEVGPAIGSAHCLIVQLDSGIRQARRYLQEEGNPSFYRLADFGGRPRFRRAAPDCTQK